MNVLIGICFLFCVLLFPFKTYAAFSFTIPETTITKDVELNANVSLSLQGQGNKTYYLEGAFKNETSTNYFGLTWDDSSWVNYTASNFTTLKSITTDSTGNWNGSVKVKIDSGSSLFTGDGTYTVRFKRFTTGGSSSWSDNTITLNVISISTSTPFPTPSPIAISSPQPSPSSAPTSSFTISNTSSQINSDQSFSLPVNLLLPNNPNTIFFLKGAFKKTDSSNYFGLTKVSGSWVKNGSSYSEQYQITTDSTGNWSGNLEVQPDSEDSGFTDTGDYIFKVGRYTSAGAGPTWSNEETIKIIKVAQGSDSSDTISNDPPSPSSTTSPSIKSIATAGQIKSSGKKEFKVASVAGVTATATPSDTLSTEVKSQKQINFPLIIGILLIVSGIGLTSYIYLQNHEKIFNKFRKRN